LILLLIV